MTARLFSRTGETRGLELELSHDREAIVGRDPAADLVIERPLMSSRHARIVYDSDAERYVLEDLGSLNGTELDGDRVTGAERLGHLHVVTFAGNYDFFFFDPERCDGRHPEPVEAARAEAPVPAETPAAVPAKEPAVTTGEVTSVEHEPVALPGFLARRADALGETPEPAGGESVPSEVTSIEREPIAVPDVLARRADGLRAEKADAEEAAAKPEKTLHEKLPVALPGVLAQRSDEAARRPNVQKHETVDLSQIEKLIAAEEAEEREADLATGLHLIVTEAGGQVVQYPLAEGENLVGRGASADVSLKYPDLSRRHAVITVEGKTVKLRDLGSRNRTFAGDRPLEPQVDVEVEPGARLRFGSVEARLARVGG